MSFIRFSLDLAIPEMVFNRIPLARKKAFRNEVRSLKALAVKISEGKDNEEMTVRTVWYVCRHDEGKSCGPVNEI